MSTHPDIGVVPLVLNGQCTFSEPGCRSYNIPSMAKAHLRPHWHSLRDMLGDRIPSFTQDRAQVFDHFFKEVWAGSVVCNTW